MNIQKNLFICLMALSIYACDTNFAGNSESGNNDSSIGGSYSTMLTVGNKLYTVSKEELSTFDISEKTKPKLIDQQMVGFQIENLYHNSGLLLIGSQTSLYIYAIDDQGIPNKKSATEYFSFGNEIGPCDPVIASNGYAYATLSSRNETGGACSRTFEIKELRTYNVINPEQPFLESSIEMKNPKGLSIDRDRLYVCEGEHGMKIFDLSQKNIPALITTVNSCQCYDIIIHNGLILAVGKKEIYQYQYGENQSLIQLKTILL